MVSIMKYVHFCAVVLNFSLSIHFIYFTRLVQHFFKTSLPWVGIWKLFTGFSHALVLFDLQMCLILPNEMIKHLRTIVVCVHWKIIQ